MPSIIAINNAKNAIFEILAKFGTMFRDEELEIEQKPEDMLKRLALASQKSKQYWKSAFETLWD